MVLAILLGTTDGIVHTTAEVDVVVLQQNHVEQSDTMVRAATNLHSLFLEHAHTWRRLSGVEHACLGAGIDQGLLVFVSHSGNARHALQDVEHEALCLQ